jgi:hypothetical protein
MPGAQGSIEVIVQQVLPEPGSTVWRGRGVEITTGDYVLFGGDWRPMYALAEQLQEVDEVLADVPVWAVLTRTPGDGPVPIPA